MSETTAPNPRQAELDKEFPPAANEQNIPPVAHPDDAVPAAPEPEVVPVPEPVAPPAPPANPNLGQLGQVQDLVGASKSALTDAAEGIITAVETILEGDVEKDIPVLVGDALLAGEAILESLAPPMVKPIIAGLVGIAGNVTNGLETLADTKIVAVLQLFVARLKALNL